jgi:alanyl-tRNA synthetase
MFCNKDLLDRGLHAGKIIGAAAKVAGGGGGGRPDMAQAGGKDITKLNEALTAAREVIEKTLV